MGKSDKWEKDNGRGWRLWHGAQSPSGWRQAPWQGAGNDNKSKFPAYDSKPPGKSHGKGPKNDKVTGSDLENADDMVGEVQRAVNNARRAENRLARLVKEREKEAAQWEEYAEEARKAFYYEKSRHLRAIQHFEKEIQAAQLTQQEARLALRERVICAGSGDRPMETAESDGEWERMLAAHEQERSRTDDAVLRRAMKEARTTGQPGRYLLPGPSLGGVPPPPPGPPGLSAMGASQCGDDPQASAYNAVSPTLRHARTDPYTQASPRATSIPDTKERSGSDGSLDRPRTSPVHPGMARRECPDPCHGVKEVTKQPPAKLAPHSDLAEKLQAKRAALLPFGVAPSGSDIGRMANSASLGDDLLRQWQGLASMTVDDDDPDLADTGQMPLTELE